ncbi:uncharacterized protein H6S33_002450 [Morchella sextelata]|uniref:uncharacterized protein n=1 Tax=Morchella sextelata TaxID=1174677 RepID=UPI001D0448AC|nr:uncharacterized protein H6S33_002450 [Morchella sextelata]KAH0607416.1 hypothetical protein H6S33_002450 [Morchella sextelata]
MANKRKKNQKSRPNTHHDTSGGGGPSNYNNSNSNTYDQTHHHKRPRYNNNNNNNSTSETALPLDGPRHGYIDPHTGQRGAFPGLEDDDGEFYGPANDGMDYLKMVRSEAKGVPSLLIAGQKNVVVKPPPREPTFVEATDELPYDDGDAPLSYDDDQLTEKKDDADAAGWYHDGTYTAAPLPTLAAEAAPPPPWHNSLLARFTALRTAFIRNPPRASRPLVATNLKMWRQRQYWNVHAAGTKPTAGVLAGLDQQMTLTLLEWLTAMLRSGRGGGKGGFVGVNMKGYWAEWVWGCLVRLDECLTADEIYVVRELGKKCLKIRKGMIDMKVGWDEGGHGDEEEEPEQDDEELENEPEDAEEAVQAQEQPEEGECSSDPEPVSTVPAAATPTPNPAEISLDDDEEAPASNPAEIAIDNTANPAAEDTAVYDPPIKIEEIPPSPPRSPKPSTEGIKEHSYADIIGALDMIISVVGGFFGQRDLLLEREAQGMAGCFAAA